MGMDLHGLNPKMNKGKDQYKTYFKWEDIGWNIRENENKEEWEKEKDKFYSQEDKYNTDNRGVYFSNNCWWWRPLWNYCYHIADDLISEKLWENGHHNSGHGLNAEDSKKLGERLMEYLANGKAMQYQEDYPKDEDYPFDVENVENFSNFLIDSGGFEVW